MYRIYKNILHSFQADFKILVYFDIYFRRILWLLSWSLQGDQGGITCACCLECIILERTYYFIKKNINNRI